MANPYGRRLDALRKRMQETGTDLVAIGPSSHTTRRALPRERRMARTPRARVSSGAVK